MNSSFFKWFRVFLLLLTVVSLAVFGWAANKGLDVSDESFYLLNYRYADTYHASFSSFHLIINTMLGGHEFSITGYRIIYLFIMALQTAIFTYGFGKWLESEVGGRMQRITAGMYGIIFCYFLLATFAIFSWAPRTLSYNGINSLVIYASAGLLLFALSRSSRDRLALLALVLAGVLLPFGFFTKISAAVLCLGWHGLMLLLVRRPKVGELLIFIVLPLAIGIGVGTLLYFGTVQSYADWWLNFNREMKVIVKVGYGPGQMVRRYLFDAMHVLLFVLWPGLPLLGACVLLTGKRAESARKPLPLYGIAAVLLLAFAYLCVRYNVFDHAYRNADATTRLLFLFLVAVVIVWFRRQSATLALRFSEIVVLVWLLALPAVAAFGTANSLLTNVLNDIVAWFAILLFFAFRLLLVPRPVPANSALSPAPLLAPNQRRVLYALLILPALYVFEQAMWGSIFRPYMLPDNLLAQTEQLEAPGIRGKFYVDARFRTFVAELYATLQRGGYQPGQSIVALNDMPGLVYLMNGWSPNAPWYFSFAFERNIHALALNPANIKGSYLLLNKELSSQEQQELQAHGLNFPAGYQLLGQLANPYNVFNADQTTVWVYAPIEHR